MGSGCERVHGLRTPNPEPRPPNPDSRTPDPGPRSNDQTEPPPVSRTDGSRRRARHRRAFSADALDCDVRVAELLADPPDAVAGLRPPRVDAWLRRRGRQLQRGEGGR